MEKMKKQLKKKVNQHLLKRQVKNILIDIFFKEEMEVKQNLYLQINIQLKVKQYINIEYNNTIKM